MKHGHSKGKHGSMKIEGFRRFKDHEYPNEQRAATLWYHDHRMDFTGPQVWRGLAGFHIIRDDEEDALPLPGGEKDVPLMICDRSFDEDGSFLYPSLDPSLLGEPGVEDDYMDGVLGDTILVNGAPWPLMEVSNTKYRFRILNASNARRYELALDPEPGDGASFVQVGSDGGLLGAPRGHRRISIGQAERFDVIIDFSRYEVGAEVTLKNRLGEGSTADVMRFRVNREEREESAIPGRLSEMGDFEALGESDATRTREFRFTRVGHDGRVMWGINGDLGPGSRPRLAPDPPAPGPFQGALPQRREPLAKGRRLEGHRGPHLGRRGATARPLRRLPGSLRLPLPQPGARGHDDDGELRGRVGARPSPPGLCCTDLYSPS
jgi:spore coat protein A